MLRSFFLAAACVLVGCSSSSEEPEWKFGAAEAHSALDGTWKGNWTLDGKSGSMELKLAVTPSAQPKCSNRTLSAGDLAPKCMDITTITLSGSVTTSDGAFTDAPVTGSMTVLSETLSSGNVSLQGAGSAFNAEYHDAKIEGRVQRETGTATFVLTR